jgi:hypothetical protein
MTIYRGSTNGVAGIHTVEVQAGNGSTVGMLTHHVRHSPDGFSWGYAGSGPADLARCLLIDHYGTHAWCEGCGGSGQQVWSVEEDRFVAFNPSRPYTAEESKSGGGCPACHGELTSFPPSVYQAFTRAIIARFPRDGSWRLTSREIDRWLQTQTQTESAARTRAGHAGPGGLAPTGSVPYLRDRHGGTGGGGS